jgi:Antidote-toxin recognition MazE, bacterial antitoxin
MNTIKKPEKLEHLTDLEYRKIQGLVGDQSFSVVLPKSYALHLGIGKGDFVKVRQEENKIVIEKA